MPVRGTMIAAGWPTLRGRASRPHSAPTKPRSESRERQARRAGRPARSNSTTSTRGLNPPGRPPPSRRSRNPSSPARRHVVRVGGGTVVGLELPGMQGEGAAGLERAGVGRLVGALAREAVVAQQAHPRQPPQHAPAGARCAGVRRCVTPRPDGGRHPGGSSQPSRVEGLQLGAVVPPFDSLRWVRAGRLTRRRSSARGRRDAGGPTCRRAR